MKRFPVFVFVAKMPRKVSAKEYSPAVVARGNDMAEVFSAIKMEGKKAQRTGRWEVRVEVIEPTAGEQVGALFLGWVETHYTENGTHEILRAQIQAMPEVWVEDGRMIEDN